MINEEPPAWPEILRALSGAKYDQREFQLGGQTVLFTRLYSMLHGEVGKDLREEQREAFQTLLGQAIRGTPRASFARLEPDAWWALNAVFTPPQPEDLAADRALLQAVASPSESWVIFAVIRPLQWRALRAEAEALAETLAPAHVVGNPLASYPPQFGGAAGNIHCNRCCGSIEKSENGSDVSEYEALVSKLKISIDPLPISCRGCPGTCQIIDDPSPGFQSPYFHVTCVLCGGSDDSDAAMSIFYDSELILESMREAARDCHDAEE
jgi:hypothetical protein